MDLAKVHNPYDFSNPISDAQLLVGREREMQEINYYLDNASTAPRPINLALLGQRASGKTSILNIVELEAKERGFCTVRINLDEDDARTQLAFFSKLFDSIISAACEAGAFGGKGGKTFDTYLDMVNAYVVPDDKTFCPFTFPIQVAKACAAGNYGVPVSDHNIRTDLERVRSELKCPIILLFDEGNVLAQSRALLQKLRNIFMNTPGFMLVMTGTPDLFPVMDEVFSPIVRQFKKIDVGEFADHSDTRDCIRKPLEKIDVHPEDIFDFETYRDVIDIHNLSGGRPYEIQLICHMLFRRVQFGRADKMKLDFGVLEEVRRELETWQDITNRPVLTTVRNLDKHKLEELGIMCSLNGSATFDQIWAFEYIFYGEQRWKKERLERALEWFLDKGVVKAEAGRIVFAGDDFDRIYTKYFAREQDVSLSFARTPLSWHWRQQLLDYLSTSLQDRIRPFQPLHAMYRGEADVFNVAAKMAETDSHEDVFVDNESIATELYTSMLNNLGSPAIPILSVNPSLSWLNTPTLFRASGSNDASAIELAIGEINVLKERIAHVGGSLTIEQRDLPAVAPDVLADKVTRSANKRVRLVLSSFHADKLRDAYVDERNMNAASIHARLCRTYDPNIDDQSANDVGYFYLSLGDLDLAREYLERAVHTEYDLEDEDDVHTLALSWYNLGIVEAKLGHIEMANEEIGRCIEVLTTRECNHTMACVFVPALSNNQLLFTERWQPPLLDVATEASRLLRLFLLRSPRQSTRPKRSFQRGRPKRR